MWLCRVFCGEDWILSGCWEHEMENWMDLWGIRFKRGEGDGSNLPSFLAQDPIPQLKKLKPRGGAAHSFPACWDLNRIRMLNALVAANLDRNKTEIIREK